MEDELFIPDMNGVAGVGPTLISGDDVGPLRQDIDDLALSLVPPLPPHHHRATTPARAIGHGIPGSFRGSGTALSNPTGTQKERPSTGEGL